MIFFHLNSFLMHLFSGSSKVYLSTTLSSVGTVPSSEFQGLINLFRLLPPSIFIKQILKLFSLHFQFLKVDPLHFISLLSMYSGLLLKSEHIQFQSPGNCVLSMKCGWLFFNDIQGFNLWKSACCDENSRKWKHHLHTLQFIFVL